MNHTTEVTDPVCGMTIDPASAVGSSTHGGRTYHFCSRGCEARFDAAPATYAGGEAAAAHGPASCCSTRGHSCC